MRIVYHPAFRIESADITTYLAERNLDAALRFVDGLEATIRRLKDFPASGTHPRFLMAERHKDLLFCLVDHFPDYMVFYRTTEDSLDLLHIVHGARDIPDLFDD